MFLFGICHHDIALHHGNIGLRFFTLTFYVRPSPKYQKKHFFARKYFTTDKRTLLELRRLSPVGSVPSTSYESEDWRFQSWGGKIFQ
jgi:hypothetical protein